MSPGKVKIESAHKPVNEVMFVQLIVEWSIQCSSLVIFLSIVNRQVLLSMMDILASGAVCCTYSHTERLYGKASKTNATERPCENKSKKRRKSQQSATHIMSFLNHPTPCKIPNNVFVLQTRSRMPSCCPKKKESQRGEEVRGKKTRLCRHCFP